MNANRQIEILERKLSALQNWNQKYALELQSIQNELMLLKKSISTENESFIEQTVDNANIFEKPNDISQQKTVSNEEYKPSYRFDENIKPKSNPTLNLEKFIGENLINKIGILITIIGIGIGASYAIEHNLINPLTRIILGYLSGFLILGTSYKLKEKYENFSAVMLGGGFTVLYFITFFAYSFYDLLPQWLAFLIMLLVTGATVFSSLKYSKQVIANLGLVGAYAVPFLLSDNTGNVIFLFSYMTLVNVGILLISIKKDWKSLFYSAFTFTFLIFIAWQIDKYSYSEYFLIANIFLIAFFGIFHTVFLAYKLRTNEQFKKIDLFWLFVNSFIFVVLMLTLDRNKLFAHYDSVITFSHALMHYFIYLFIRKQNLSDKKVENFILGMAISLLTITIPVLFDGYWVTGFWIAEAAVLFWLSSRKYEKIFEYFSYSMIVLSSLSLLFDWDKGYSIFYVHTLKEHFNFVLNVNFLNSLIFILGIGVVHYLKNKNPKIISTEDEFIKNVVSTAISGLLFVVIYISFALEISYFWQKLYLNSPNSVLNKENLGEISKNFDLMRYHDICLMLYSMIFASILTYLNATKYKIESLIKLNLSINFIHYLIFIFSSTFILYMLSISYLDSKINIHYQQSIFNILIKYISYAIFALLFYSSNLYLKQNLAPKRFSRILDILLFFSIFWTVSYELITWMNYFDSPHTFKLGLSILWGIFSLVIIAIGIWKKKKHLRIFAIALFGITLLKLFFIDASHLATIPKTILFVTLGILLLVISFLYNKYKHIINDNNQQRENNLE